MLVKCVDGDHGFCYLANKQLNTIAEEFYKKFSIVNSEIKKSVSNIIKQVMCEKIPKTKCRRNISEDILILIQNNIIKKHPELKTK